MKHIFLIIILFMVSCNGTYEGFDDIECIPVEEEKEPYTIKIIDTIPEYKILPTYIYDKNNNTFVIKDLANEESKYLIELHYTTAKFSKANIWGDYYYIFPHRYSYLNIPSEHVIITCEEETIVGGIVTQIYIKDYSTFNGVHLSSAKVNGEYAGSFAGFAGNYNGKCNDDFSYGRSNYNALKLTDVINELKITELSENFTIYFYSSFFDGLAFLYIVDDSKKGEFYEKVVAKKILTKFSVDMCNAVEVNSVTNLDSLYIYLTAGDWASSVIILNIKGNIKNESTIL